MNEADPLAPFNGLLPLRGIAVTLSFSGPAKFSFFHQAAVHALVRGLCGSPDNFADLLTVDAPESGRRHYRTGDRYRFTVIGLPGSEVLLARLITALRKLPHSAPVHDSPVPLRNNLQLIELADLFEGKPVDNIAELTRYDRERLAGEAAMWTGAPLIQLQWRSPARLKRSKVQREQQGERRRYCAELADLGDGLLAARVRDALAELARRRGIEVPARQLASGIPAPQGHVFWVDSEYHDANGRAQQVGGLCGQLNIGPGAELAPDWLTLLVLGQYIGIGERRAFGLGRYRLCTLDRWSTLAEQQPAATLLQHAAREDAVYAAYSAIRDNQGTRRPRDTDESPDADVLPDDIDPSLPDPEEEDRLADRLEGIARHLSEATYQPPVLRGVVIRKPDGDLRGLAIPPFWDRVAQRAVNDQVAPACELLLDTGSHGYRRGRSRHTASLDINRAWRDGYRWIYEADIEDFFDNVDWEHLRIRLEALYRDDPAVALILAWMAAPVTYQGAMVQRRSGLPQGAPLSPTMANLMLDDFDADLRAAGFRLVRYADDFVVLCRSREEAEAAGQAARNALAQLGLNLNDDKSRVVSFEQGFRFLGFLFMNSLVVDVGGERGEAKPTGAKADRPAPSPNSWLAKIARQTPQPLDPKAPPQPAATAPEPNAPLGAGERGDDGMLLIVSGHNALVSSSKGRVVISRDDKTVTDTPWRGLAGLLLLGNHHITTPALRHAMKHDVPVHFASRGGRYQGIAWSHQAGADGAALWLLQRQRCAEPDWALRAARALVMARIRHMREVLRQRNPQGFREQREQLRQALKEAGRVSDRGVLNGLEGNATRAYFAALTDLVPPDYGFHGRNRRPPRDPFNALLSLGYSVLHSHVVTLLHVAGLYPWIGVYHQSHGTHATLASDFIEPFRHIVERTALVAVGRGGIPPEAFRYDSANGCRLTPVSLKRFLGMLWERLEQPVGRVGDEQSYDVLQQLHRQNRRFIQALRDGDDFDPWVNR